MTARLTPERELDAVREERDRLAARVTELEDYSGECASIHRTNALLRTAEAERDDALVGVEAGKRAARSARELVDALGEIEVLCGDKDDSPRAGVERVIRERDALRRHADAMAQGIETIEIVAREAYMLGYRTGHHDTVESRYHGEPGERWDEDEQLRSDVGLCGLLDAYRAEFPAATSERTTPEGEER